MTDFVDSAVEVTMEKVVKTAVLTSAMVIVTVAVELVPADSDTGVPVASATTGADGVYTITGVAPGDYQVYFRADPLRYVSQWWWYTGAILSLGLGDRPSDVNATLQDATSSFSGVVSGARGTPLAGVTVDVFLGDDLVTPAATRTTGADGSYRFEWLARGLYRLRYDAGPTYAVQWYPQQPDPTQAWQIGNWPGFHVDDLNEEMLQPLSTPPTPTISGTAKIGNKLSAVPGSWGPSPVTLKYQWKFNNVTISGATAATYTLPASTLGQKITVTVSGTKADYVPKSMLSAPTAAVAAGTLTAPTPKITGTVKVGYKLTAVAGSWGPSPVTLKYRWMANKVAISGATASTYTVPAIVGGPADQCDRDREQDRLHDGVDDERADSCGGCRNVGCAVRRCLVALVAQGGSAVHGRCGHVAAPPGTTGPRPSFCTVHA